MYLYEYIMIVIIKNKYFNFVLYVLFKYVFCVVIHKNK